MGFVGVDGGEVGGGIEGWGKSGGGLGQVR